MKNSGSRELGASLIEYTLLLALVSVVTLPALRYVGSQSNNEFNKAGQELGGTAPGDSGPPGGPGGGGGGCPRMMGGGCRGNGFAGMFR